MYQTYQTISVSIFQFHITLCAGYDAEVGERGVQLSGGALIAGKTENWWNLIPFT